MARHRAAVLKLLERRFGRVPEEVRGVVEGLSELEALEEATVAAGLCESLEEFRQVVVQHASTVPANDQD